MLFNSLSRGPAAAEEFGDSRMATFQRKAQGGLAVVRLGVQIRSVTQEDAHNCKMAIGGRGDQWRITRGIAVIGIGSIFQEPRDNRGVPAGDSSGQGVVARSVGRGGVHIRAFGKQILGRIAMPKNSGQSEDRKTIRRVTLCQGRILLHEMLDALKLTRGSNRSRISFLPLYAASKTPDCPRSFFTVAREGFESSSAFTLLASPA